MASVDESAVVDAEHSLYRAMIDRDFAALDRILAPGLHYVHSTGVVETRARYLEGIAGGLYEYEAITSRDVSIRISGAIAVSRGIVDMSVGAAGQPKRFTPLLFVLVWVRDGDGRWQLDYRQATRIA